MDEFSFFILAGCWVALHSYLLAFGCIVMGILYYLALQNLEFVIDNNSVRKTNFPRMEYSWDRFSNVILRDNILTLDFNNNKLIQIEIEDDLKINETEFNQFAERRLTKHINHDDSVT